MTTALAASAVLLSAALGEAQTYRFQLQPYCNKITVTLLPSSSPSVAGLVGYDDNCGDAPRLPIYGSGVVNPDGSFSLGFTTSESCGCGLHTFVEWPANAGSGSWSDDAGDSGSFVYDLLDQPSG